MLPFVHFQAKKHFLIAHRGNHKYMGSLLRLHSHTNTKTNPAAQDSLRVMKIELILSGSDDSGLISSGSFAIFYDLIMMIRACSN